MGSQRWLQCLLLKGAGDTRGSCGTPPGYAARWQSSPCPALTLLEGIEDVDEGEVVSVRVEQGPPAHGHGLLQVGGGGHKAGGSWG